MAHLNTYDTSWIDFDYLERNRININFKRDKEWLEDEDHVREVMSFEDELFFDKYLTSQEKSVLNKVVINPCCEFCKKEYKRVGAHLFKHQANCFLNPKVAEKMTLSIYKSKVLKANGLCLKCGDFFPAKLRTHANTCFAGVSDFSHYLPKPDCINNEVSQRPPPDLTLLSELPFFNFVGPLTEKEIYKFEASPNHLDQINDIKTQHKNKFILLYLNINSVFNKDHELDQVFNICNPDAFLIDESKLDQYKPNSWYINKKYYCICLDRDQDDKDGGGGELVFLKKGTIIKKQMLTNFETIYFQLYVDGQLVNMLLSYKSPSTNNNIFLEKLENFLISLDPDEPLFHCRLSKYGSQKHKRFRS
jgi:hypothetical protein